MINHPATKKIRAGAELILDLAWILIKISYLGMAGYGIVLVLVWALDRDFPTTVYNGHITGIEGKPEGKPEDLLSVHWRMLKTRNCPGITTRTLSGACGTHNLAITTPSAPAKPSTQEFIINFHIPDSSTPGTCEYNTHQEYWCNPLHRIFPLTKDFPTLYFTVTNDHTTAH